METFVQSFSDLVRDRLSELRLNAFSAENAAGLPPDAIRNVLRSEKQAGPTLARTKEICDALGLEIRIAPKHELAASTAGSGVNALRGEDEAPAGFLTVPWVDGLPGSGSAPVCFSFRWLVDHELTIDFLQAVIPDRVEIDGVPLVDVLAVVDNRAGLRKGHSLWCYRFEGRIWVSHVTFGDQLLILHPARPEDAPRIVTTEDISGPRMLGKVVWLGQSVPFKGQVK